MAPRPYDSKLGIVTGASRGEFRETLRSSNHSSSFPGLSCCRELISLCRHWGCRCKKFGRQRLQPCPSIHVRLLKGADAAANPRNLGHPWHQMHTRTSGPRKPNKSRIGHNRRRQIAIHNLQHTRHHFPHRHPDQQRRRLLKPTHERRQPRRNQRRRIQPRLHHQRPSPLTTNAGRRAAPPQNPAPHRPHRQRLQRLLLNRLPGPVGLRG